MVIHFKYSSVYTSIPDLLTIPSLLCPPPITIRSLCKSVSLFLFCKCVHLYHLFRFHTHFSLNLVTDVVMIATDVACTFSVCSKSVTFASPSSLNIFHIKRDVLGKTFICNWSRIYKAPGARQSLHSDFVISFSLTYD